MAIYSHDWMPKTNNDGEFQQVCDYMLLLGCIECGNMMSAQFDWQACGCIVWSKN